MECERVHPGCSDFANFQVQSFPILEPDRFESLGAFLVGVMKGLQLYVIIAYNRNIGSYNVVETRLSDFWITARFQHIMRPSTDGLHAQIEVHLDHLSGAKVVVKRFARCLDLRSLLERKPQELPERQPCGVSREL